jgi:hypothetical protein
MSANLDDGIDFEKLASELVRALRGKRSQISLSRKLGYRTNQLYRWEAGLRTISWADFVTLCHAVEAPLGAQLKSVLFFSGKPSGGSGLVKYLMKELPVSRVSSLTGLSRFSISRWVSQKTEPGLSEVLQLMHRLWSLLFVFLDGWIPTEEIPSIASSFQQQKREKGLFYHRPLSTAVLESLKLEGYRSLKTHSDQWIADAIGADTNEIRELINELESVGLIAKMKSKYKVLRSFSSMNGNFALYKSVRAYWFQKSLDYYQERSVVPKSSLAPALTFACSEKAMQSIIASYRNFLTEMQSILSKDGKAAQHLMVHSSILLELNEAGNR